MKLCIPTIGTELVLTKDWHFRLFYEDRNYKLVEKLGLLKEAFETARDSCGNPMPHLTQSHYGAMYWDSDVCVLAMLGKGTRVKVDRIYIRKGTKDKKKYDSVTFWVKSGPYKGARFWAKLMDVNLMECDLDESTLPENYREELASLTEVL